MATTFSIQGTTSLLDARVDVKAFNKAEFTLVDTGAKGNGREALYQSIAGDPQYPLTIREGCYPNPSGLNGVSTRVNLWVEKTVDGVVTEVKPGNFVLSSNLPFGLVPTASEWAAIVYALAVWNAPPEDNAPYTPQTDFAARKAFGVVNDMLDLG